MKRNADGTLSDKKGFNFESDLKPMNNDTLKEQIREAIDNNTGHGFIIDADEATDAVLAVVEPELDRRDNIIQRKSELIEANGDRIDQLQAEVERLKQELDNERHIYNKV